MRFPFVQGRVACPYLRSGGAVWEKVFCGVPKNTNKFKWVLTNGAEYDNMYSVYRRDKGGENFREDDMDDADADTCQFTALIFE